MDDAQEIASRALCDFPAAFGEDWTVHRLPFQDSTNVLVSSEIPPETFVE
jgi:hypothetical protein